MCELEELGTLCNGTILDVTVHDNYAYMTVNIDGVVEQITSFTLPDKLASIVWETFDIDNILEGKEAEFVITECGYRFTRLL